MVIINTFAQVREIIGFAEIDIPGQTGEEIVRQLITQFPALEKLLLRSSNPLQYRDDWEIFINGRELRNPQDLWTKRFRSTDEIIFSPKNWRELDQFK